MATNIEISHLTIDVYRPLTERIGYGRFLPFGVGIDNVDTGLRMQAYHDRAKLETVIVTGGPDAATASQLGITTTQSSPLYTQAIDYANAMAQNPQLENNQFITTGHQLGGTVAHLLAHTFGWNGLATDATSALLISQDSDYQDHLTTQNITAKNSEKFINVTQDNGQAVATQYSGQNMQSVVNKDIGKRLLPGLMLIGADATALAMGQPLTNAAVVTQQAVQHTERKQQVPQEKSDNHSTVSFEENQTGEPQLESEAVATPTAL